MFGILLPSTTNETRLADSLLASNGRTVLVPSTSSGWDQGGAGAPRQDWRPVRLGADPPLPLVDLRSRVTEAVLAACGVPVELVQRADGTALRESWRQFVQASVGALTANLAVELADKLETAVEWDLRPLGAAPLAERARTFRGLVAAGMDAERAARIAGLD